MKSPLLLVSAFFLLTCSFGFAGSATWKPHSVSGDWNTATNWRPRTIPNGPSDIATFGVSDTTDLSLTAQIEVDSVVFNPGASAFTVTGTYPGRFTFSGAGITNNAGVTQSFVGDGYYPEGLAFHNQANAGSQTVLTTHFPFPSIIAFYDESSAGSAMLIMPGNDEYWDAGTQLNFYQSATADHSTIITSGGSGGSGGYYAEGALTSFYDNSTAGNAIITINAATNKYAFPGALYFNTSATAGDSVITMEGGLFDSEIGGVTRFRDDTTGGNATITANGATVSAGGPSEVTFDGNANAENATLIANGGSNGGDGGLIQFSDSADGGTARVELYGNGTLDVSGVTDGLVSIGSLEGDGIVLLGTPLLYVGDNNLSTVFSGIIQGSGVVTKAGSGTLTLSGANTYTGGTTVVGGFLKLSNRNGSGTGSGKVTIYSGGTLGGSGIVGGSILVATGGNLAPGTGATTLTVKKRLVFGGASYYTWRVKTTSLKTDKVIAGAVTIGSGAFFSGIGVGHTTLPPGTTSTIIDNTSRDPIVGTFSNLPDGGTIQIGNNTFQADYKDGDGNDLTLTVVP
jgi:autotransporter-associated beta strand protein